MKQDVTASPRGRSAAKRKRERHRWFDQWRVARGEPLRKLVASTAQLVERREPAYFARQRARRTADLANHHRAIEGVVANLAYAVLNPPDTGRLAVNVRHGERGRSRYDSPAFGTRFADLLYVLWQEQLLHYRHSRG